MPKMRLLSRGGGLDTERRDGRRNRHAGAGRRIAEQPSPPRASILNEGCHLMTLPRALPHRASYATPLCMTQQQAAHTFKKISEAVRDCRAWPKDKPLGP